MPEGTLIKEIIELDMNKKIEKNEIHDIVTKKFKNMSYDDFIDTVDDAVCFVEHYKNKSYYFEVHVEQVTPEKRNIMVECSLNIFFIRMFGQQTYFSISQNGKVEDISFDEFYKER